MLFLIQCHMRMHCAQLLQLCPTLCDLMVCSLPGSSDHGILQARIIGVVCHVLLQGIFLTQGSNLCRLHCRQILYSWATRKTHNVIYIKLIISHLSNSVPPPSTEQILQINMAYILYSSCIFFAKHSHLILMLK